MFKGSRKGGEEDSRGWGLGRIFAVAKSDGCKREDD